MSKFRVVTPKGASFTVAGGGYDYEREALDPIGAEIVWALLEALQRLPRQGAAADRAGRAAGNVSWGQPQKAGEPSSRAPEASTMQGSKVKITRVPRVMITAVAM